VGVCGAVFGALPRRCGATGLSPPEVFNGLRYIAKTGSQWRFMPNDLPPWAVVYQQMRRWMDARCFEIMVEDLRILLREFAGRKGQPTAMILDSRTLQSTSESGARGGYDGAKRRKGSKLDRRLRVRLSNWRMSIRDTPAKMPRRQRRNAEFSCRWSSIPRSSADSSFYPAAGWWNAALPGPPASAAWPETMSGLAKPSPVYTTSLSPSSCSQISPANSRKVNNRL